MLPLSPVRNAYYDELFNEISPFLNWYEVVSLQGVIYKHF